MINAIHKGKAGHWLKGVDDDTHWRDSVPTYEDYLTSAFFEAYFKLPGTLLAEVNRKLFANTFEQFSFLHMDENFEYEFWPRYYGDGQSFLEPDIIVVSKALKRILIVEAKIEYAYQNQEQLDEQFAEIVARYDKSFSVWVLAIGGQRAFPETGKYYSHIKWRQVFDVLAELSMPYRYSADFALLRKAFGFENRAYISLESIGNFIPGDIVWPNWPRRKAFMEYSYGDDLPKSLGAIWK